MSQRKRTLRSICLCGMLAWPLLVSGQGVQFSDSLESGGRGPLMVTIEPGEFQMGCVSGILCEHNRPTQLPQHSAAECARRYPRLR